MLDKVRRLIEKDYAAQRSEEWLRLRGNMLTASDAATAIGVNPYEKPKDLILKKCGYNEFKGNEATMHGNKYEDEARDIYCIRNNEVSHEIGLYQHPKYPWLGGSPDGITESGKLIEIKCPVTRQPDGKVPKDYYSQMQMQLFVTDLEACDFVEAVFYSPYSSPLKKDGPGLYYGEIALIHRIDEQGLEQDGRYEYGPVSVEPAELWMPVLGPGEVITERVPWKLLEWHEQVTMRSATWWDTTKPFVDAFWLDVERARTDSSFLDEHLKKKVVEEEKCLIRLSPN
jgi:putative phage-type endonuclease